MSEDRVYEGRDLEAMSFAENYHRWIFREVEPHLGRRIIEVGAGAGDFARLLLETNPERLHLVEPSANHSATLLNRFSEDRRVQVWSGFLTEVASEVQDEIDTIVYVNVLEHVRNDTVEIASVYSTLRRGGNVCIFVPALAWLYSDFDARVGHYRRYGRAGIIDLLRSNGFEIIEVKYMDIVGILPWYLVYTLGRRTLAGAHVVAYDRAVVPWLQRLERAIHPPIGKNLLAIGRKPSEG